jgi:hypothetical protein
MVNEKDGSISKEDFKIEGIYSLAYTGIVGSGILLLIFKENVISGADFAGATYDGQYKVEDDKSISCDVTMTVPPNTPLVTGQAGNHREYKIAFSITLPSDFLVPNIIPLELPTGPVNAFFRKLKDV